jgi:hypothetical protein
MWVACQSAGDSGPVFVARWLAVLPLTDHAAVVSAAEGSVCHGGWLASMVEAFLDADAP